MKTKEEIEQLAESEYGTEIGSIRGSNPYDLEKDRKNGYIKGYTQCQEDVTDAVKKQISDFTIDLKESTSTYIKQNCEGAIFGLNRLLQALNKQD
jgi:hypothetical protein